MWVSGAMEVATAAETSTEMESSTTVDLAGAGPFCRICYDSDPGKMLNSPCNCTGTIGLVHADCLSKWLNTSGRSRCELCSANYRVSRKLTNPMTWWKKACRVETLEDRRCIQCLSCHLIVTICFLWSLIGGVKDILESDDLFRLLVKLFICCLSGVSAVVIFVTGGRESYVHWTRKVACAVSRVDVMMDGNLIP